MTDPQTTRRKKLLLLFGSTLLTLLLAEGAYRLVQAQRGANAGDDDWYRRYRHMNQTIYQRSSDSRLIYEPVRGASVQMEYGVAGFNAQALRDEQDTSSDAAPGVTRVAMLGDSLVWSEFLSSEDSLPRQTEAALGSRYEVLNAGVTGYDTTQESIWYERAVRPLHPDVVVLVYCMNDMLIMSGPYGRFATPDEARLKDEQDALFQRLAPVRRETIDDWISENERGSFFRLFARTRGLWERWRFEQNYVDEPLLAFRDRVRRDRTAAALAHLGELIAADGARPVLVISPILESWRHYRWSPIHRFVGQAAEASGFTVLDPIVDLRRQHSEREFRSGSDNLHYGARGARILGRWLANKLRP